MKFKKIDTDTLEGKIEVMKAYQDGAKIAVWNTYSQKWVLLFGSYKPSWNWVDQVYAVVDESEPETGYVVDRRVKGNKTWELFNYYKMSESEIEAKLKDLSTWTRTYEYRARKFIEVT